MEDLSKSLKNIIIINENILYRVILKKMLTNYHSLRVCAEFDKSEDALEYVKYNPVDIVLISNLPHIDIVQTSTLLKTFAPNIKIILFSSSSQEKDLIYSLSAKADAYVYNNLDIDKLHYIINWVYYGYFWIDIDFQFNVFSIIKSLPEEAYNSFKSSLNVNEFEVILLVLKGHNNHEISTLLNLSVNEIFSIVSSIFSKLVETSKCELI